MAFAAHNARLGAVDEGDGALELASAGGRLGEGFQRARQDGLVRDLGHEAGDPIVVSLQHAFAREVRKGSGALSGRVDFGGQGRCVVVSTVLGEPPGHGLHGLVAGGRAFGQGLLDPAESEQGDHNLRAGFRGGGRRAFRSGLERLVQGFARIHLQARPRSRRSDQGGPVRPRVADGGVQCAIEVRGGALRLVSSDGLPGELQQGVEPRLSYPRKRQDFPCQLVEPGPVGRLCQLAEQVFADRLALDDLGVLDEPAHQWLRRPDVGRIGAGVGRCRERPDPLAGHPHLGGQLARGAQRGGGLVQLTRPDIGGDQVLVSSQGAVRHTDLAQDLPGAISHPGFSVERGHRHQDRPRVARALGGLFGFPGCGGDFLRHAGLLVLRGDYAQRQRLHVLAGRVGGYGLPVLQQLLTGRLAFLVLAAGRHTGKHGAGEGECDAQRSRHRMGSPGPGRVSRR